MAGPRGLTTMFTIAIASILAIQSVYGKIVCENLPTEMCAFSVSSAGMRCVLEKYKHGWDTSLQCKTSRVKVDGIAGWVESDRCVDACGVDRSSVGISSDPITEVQFMERLCSAACYGGCPNIVDLYFNLAAAEGISLLKLCESLKDSPRRGMFETLSSGPVVPAPGSMPPSLEPTPAPASEPGLLPPPPPPSESTPAPASEPVLFPPSSEPTPVPASEPGLLPPPPPPSEPTPASEPVLLPPSSEPTPTPASEPGTLAPPSEPTPSPASEPTSSSEPAPLSEPVPAPASQPAPAPGSTLGSEAVTGSDKKKKQDKDKKNKKKHHKKKGDKKKKEKHHEKKKKNHEKKKHDKKHDKKKHQKKEHHKE